LRATLIVPPQSVCSSWLGSNIVMISSADEDDEGGWKKANVKQNGV
jgi:hypothetical protein